MTLRVICPAKVNLFLSVGPRDERGYHPLRTVFQAIDLCDVLEVEFGESVSSPQIEIIGADLPLDNTITKALRLSRELFVKQPTQIRLEKNIPMQAGLGGGSSDAAGLIRALAYANNQQQTTNSDLSAIAAAVGADVPFFLTGGRAKGAGYGDRITPLPDAPETWFVIAKPAIGCSTSEMYARLDDQPLELHDWPEERGPGDARSDEPCNDFERVAPPECLDLIVKLQELGARMSTLAGSGSSVFGRFSSKAEAESAAGRLQNAQRYLAKTLTRGESLRVEPIP